MFGGAGLYRDGKMFGLIADDVAYLKADDSLTNLQKAQMLVEIRREFQNPVPIFDAERKRQTYWYRLYNRSFSCDLELPISKMLQEDSGDGLLAGGLLPDSLGFDTYFALSPISYWLPQVIFHSGDIMKYYSCESDETKIHYQCMKQSVYINDTGERCARFECKTNHPKRKAYESVMKPQPRILCESVDGELYYPADLMSK